MENRVVVARSEGYCGQVRWGVDGKKVVVVIKEQQKTIFVIMES